MTEGREIRTVEEARKEAYAEGAEAALRDYEIRCFPYLSYSEKFFGKKTEVGYLYQLYVKGAPTLAPGKVIVHSEEKFNEQVRAAALKAIDDVIVTLATPRIGGIPVKVLPKRETKV